MRGRLWFSFSWTLSLQKPLPVVFSVTDEANKLGVKQTKGQIKSSSENNPAYSQHGSIAGIYESLQSRQMPKLLPDTNQVQPVHTFIKQGYLCGVWKCVMEISVQWDSLMLYRCISCAYSHTNQALQLKCWIKTALQPSSQGLWSTPASLNPVLTCCKLEIVLCWAAPQWQRESVGSVIAVLVTLECSCSFLVPKQPVLFKQAASNTSGHYREKTPEPLFLSIPTSFKRQI